MPKVISQTPPWLCRPSPGARIFSDPSAQSPSSPAKRASRLPSTDTKSSSFYSPKRSIAHRGTEVFTAYGNKIRWADLAKVKDRWEESIHRKQDDEDDVCYRTLSTPVYYQIRQLSVSPSGHFLAICTEHTVHVAVLPDASRLGEPNSSPLKLKTYHVGPTTHVIPESPLASVLWHPLAMASQSTDCLVTVTAEAALRVWELDRANQWSFERPALALDLRKLADGISADQDFEPSGFGKNRGFSADDFDMEVAATCFGGQGRNDENAWASMTLWFAMKNGDIYALCPLLPSRWQPAPSTIPSLSIAAVERQASMAGGDKSNEEREAIDQQYEWVQELDNEEPVFRESGDESEVRQRPTHPSAIPRLQGPFEMLSEDEDVDMDVTDLTVFPACLADVTSDEDDYVEPDASTRRLPFTTLAVALSDAQVYIALDLDGVSGQWLPKKGRSTFGLPDSDTKDLAVVTALQLEKDMAVGQLMLSFTQDPTSSYTTFVTTGSTVHSISLDDWSSRLSTELAHENHADSGLQTRLASSCSGSICTVEEVVKSSAAQAETLSAPIVIDDVDLGYLLLTNTLSEAYAVTFDRAHFTQLSTDPSSNFRESQSRMNMQLVELQADYAQAGETLPSRSAYVPPGIFYSNPEVLFKQLRRSLNHRQTSIVNEHPMKLSPALLDVMTFTHRAVSRHATELESAAAELFRRCDRVREELGDQVKLMTELADRLQRLRANDDDDHPRKSSDERLADTREKQETLLKRYEALRRKVAKVSSAKKELSSKELAWVGEIQTLNEAVGEKPDEFDGNIPAPSTGGNLEERFHTAQKLSQHFIEEANSLKKVEETTAAMQRSDSTASRKSAKGSSDRSLVSSRHHKERIAEVMGMVEREGAVIEAVKGRLEKLKV